MPVLSQYHISESDELYYISNFVTAEEESLLVRKICQSPLPKWKSLANRRLQIWGGNMTTKGFLIPDEMPAFVTKYPDIIGRIKATGAFHSSPHGAPNHVILNEYLPGQGIMPHEDGPAYFPAVATLSLGSHALFHYYRYTPLGSPAPDEGCEHTSNEGRVIDPDPVLSLLLEPRSLVITTSAMYTSHLHGIEDVTEDVFPPPPAGDERLRARVANADMLTGGAERDAVLRGGTLRRGPRYSLTFRDVGKVARGIPFQKR